MNVLFDIVHPAHVHFFRHMRDELLRRGHETLVVSREKDVACELLDAYGIPHVPVGRSGPKGLLRQGAELAQRDIALFRLSRRFKPDLVLTRNPSGVEVARLVGAVGVFDTDCGRTAGVHYWSAAPFAHVITAPASPGRGYGRKHRLYRGYKSLAYLHPNRFQPDPTVRDALQVGPDGLYSVVRFVAFHASHDIGKERMDISTKREVIRKLERLGPVFVSSEDDVPPEFRDYLLPTPSHRLHDVLAGAAFYAGDSQTVAAEAAMLGVPAVHCSPYSGRLAYLTELEERYRLISSFPPSRSHEFLQAIEVMTRDLAETRARAREYRDVMLTENIDVTSWFVDLAEELIADRTRRGGALIGRRRTLS